MKKKVLAGEKGEHVHVPESKRNAKFLPSKNHALWLNDDTVSADSSATSGVYKTRRVASTNSSKTGRE
jgi:hypothetical protein